VCIWHRHPLLDVCLRRPAARAAFAPPIENPSPPRSGKLTTERLPPFVRIARRQSPRHERRAPWPPHRMEYTGRHPARTPRPSDRPPATRSSTKEPKKRKKKGRESVYALGLSMSAGKRNAVSQSSSRADESEVKGMGKIRDKRKGTTRAGGVRHRKKVLSRPRRWGQGR
jgi:hypothetical protein